MRRKAGKGCLALLVALGVGGFARPASSWEAATTHAGLTEQAAKASGLHRRLRELFAAAQGLYAPLTIPPETAESLRRVMETLDPSGGYVADARGRLVALGWLVAGSSVADTPAAWASHHFYDAFAGERGPCPTRPSLRSRIRHSALSLVAGSRLESNRIAAPEWITHGDNPMNLSGFFAQYDKAISSATRAGRSRHLAGALLAAGAMLHVLQDMGSPSRVRADLAAHFASTGPSRLDVSSRMERLASIAYGRLGVPAPNLEIQATTLRGLFTDRAKSGLADITARSWFSPFTLPCEVKLPRGDQAMDLSARILASLRRPEPVPLATLDLAAARSPDGARLVNERGTCVARYRREKSLLSWHLDDACTLEQLAVILPLVASYSRALLDYLFRGELEVAQRNDGLNVRGIGDDYGSGTVSFFWQDRRGVRALFHRSNTRGGKAGSHLARAPLPPQQAVAVAVLFRGTDKQGSPFLAARTVPFPIASGE